MRTVAVVSEFNPFHNGHHHFVSEVRRALGDDTCIVALMSGNYTQRGDVAIADKFARAAAAVCGGVDLVLELPFPFSTASAEFFATAGVRLAASLGIVDTIAFGSECGDLALLQAVAARISTAEFTEAVCALSERLPTLGHATLTERAYRAAYGDEGAELLTTPNDTLALQYLAANAALEAPLEAFAVKRVGSYHSRSLDEAISATAVRAALVNTPDAAVDAMPAASLALLWAEIEAKRAPADISRLFAMFLSFFRLVTPDPQDEILCRLHKAAIRATDLEDLMSLAATKRYTHAHLRRALWHRLLGVTSAELREPPAYTQVLAMNDRGRQALRKAARASMIPLLTKPADARALTGAAAKQAALAQRADLLYPLAMPVPTAGNVGILAAPYRKN